MTSAVATAKAAQGYTTLLSNCGHCKHMTFEMVQPTWTTNPVYARERNLRCGIGKFAVKKTATCNNFEVRK